MDFSIKYRFIILLLMTYIEFVTLHLNLLLCWHGFRDVNGMVTVNVGIRWRRHSCFCGCLVNVTICNTTFDWPTNHSPPNIIHDQLLIWTTRNQFIGNIFGIAQFRYLYGVDTGNQSRSYYEPNSTVEKYVVIIISIEKNKKYIVNREDARFVDIKVIF